MLHASYFIARPDSQFQMLYMYVLLCDILWPEVQSQPDDSHVHATGVVRVLHVHSLRFAL